MTIGLGDVEVMQTIRFTALIAFGLGTPAMAAGTVPEEYQGVWAAARDCRGNFQNVLSNVVNREFAANGIRRRSGLSQRDGKAADYQGDKKLGPTEN